MPVNLSEEDMKPKKQESGTRDNKHALTVKVTCDRNVDERSRSQEEKQQLINDSLIETFSENVIWYDVRALWETSIQVTRL